MSKLYKLTFETKDGDKEIQLAVNRPNIQQKKEGKKVWNMTFNDAIKSGAFLKQELAKEIKNRKLFDEEKEKQLNELNEALQRDLAKCDIKRGGIKLEEAKDAAFRVRINRYLVSALMQEVQTLVANSAESQADDAEFDYLVSVCTVYNTDGKQYFKDLEDYLERKDEEVAVLAANSLIKIVYNYEEDFEKKLPENAFLLKYGFVDNKLNVIEKEPVKPVEEEKVEFKPFLDEEGNEVSPVDA